MCQNLFWFWQHRSSTDFNSASRKRIRGELIRLSVFLSVEDGARVSEFHFCFGKHQRALGAGAAVWVLYGIKR